MLRLRTLGGLSIENDASIGAATANRRPLALLALLAVSGRQGLSRDKIVALLWPESDAERGRNSLSQAISLLRRESATDDIVLGSAELRVNTDVLACDVIEFEHRIAADDLPAAIALYRGSFLDGVFLKNAPEFERWVDQERSRLERMQADALEHLATRASAAGDHVSAVRFWRQRAGLAPSDSRAALKLMEALVASGDPAGALAHYRVHQVLLREEGLEPDAPLAALVAALRSKGNQRGDAATYSSRNIFASAGFRDDAGTQPPSNGSLRDEPAGRTVTAPRRARLITAAVVVLALITAALGLHAKGSGAVSQVALLLPDGMDLHSSGAALSPDGKTIVYAAVAEGSTDSPPRLYVHRLGELQPRLLEKTEGASYPFFSPDGGSVGFTVGDGLKTISLTDRSIASVADNLGLGGAGVADASWGDDGYILFGSNMDRQRIGIRGVSARGGGVEVVSRPETSKSEAAHYAPQRLPGTETLIYSVRSSDARGITYRAVALDLVSGRSHDLIEGAILARYIDGGWLAYQIGRDVFVSRFDVRTLVLSSERRRVVDGVFFWLRGRAWTANADVFIYQPEVATKGMLVWVSRDGTHRDTLPLPPDNYEGPNLSPTGDRIALLVRNDGLTDAWTYDLGRSVLTKVSSDGITGSARWTPDGKRLTYRRRSRTGLDLYTRAADGTGPPELLFGNGGVLWPADWTRDMRTLVVMQHDTVTNGGDLWTLDVASKTLRPLVRTPAAEFGGRLSPDGRWLAYASDVSGRWELYVTSFPGANRRWQVSQHGGREAMWSKDGRELFFRNGKAVMVAAVRPGATFDWEPPRVLFEGNFWHGEGAGSANYDVSSDGKRFLMIQEPERGAPRLNVIHEWQRLGIETVVPNR